MHRICGAANFVKGLLDLNQILQINEAAQMLMFDNEFHMHTTDVMQVASKSRCSAYDYEFVALAQEFGVPLVTSDELVLKEFPDVAMSPVQFVT